MKTYTIWTHYDTGIQQKIKTENEDEALEKAEENLESKDFSKQLMDNLQRGEADITKEE